MNRLELAQASRKAVNTILNTTAPAKVLDTQNCARTFCFVNKIEDEILIRRIESELLERVNFIYKAPGARRRARKIETVRRMGRGNLFFLCNMSPLYILRTFNSKKEADTELKSKRRFHIGELQIFDRDQYNQLTKELRDGKASTV